MKKFLSIIFIAFSSVYRLYGQEKLELIEKNKCDILQEKISSFKLEEGHIPFLTLNNSSVVYFTKEDDFYSFIDANTRNESEKPIIDFKNFDVVFVQVGGLYENTFLELFENEKSYILKLNSYKYEQINSQESNEYKNLAIKRIYSHYFKLPKGKEIRPEFYFYKTIYKCD